MGLDGVFYLNLICSIAGVGCFIYGFLIINKIKKLFPGAKMTRKWLTMQILIVIFLVGYEFNIVFLALEMTDFVNFMTAIVYFFGGFFVLIIINLGYRTYKLILLDSSSKK